MIIRALKETDKEMVQSFFDNMSAHSASFFNVNHGNEKRTMEFFENGKKDHNFFVVTDEKEIIALSFIWDINTSIPWFGIAVSDRYQGQGIGSMFIADIFARLKKQGYGGLLLRTHTENIPAQRLYEKCGFERLGMHPSGEYLYLKRWKENARD